MQDTALENQVFMITFGTGIDLNFIAFADRKALSFD